MKQAGAPAATGTQVSGWLLPGSRGARLRLEKVVTNAANDGERSTRRIRLLGAVARRALVEEIEIKLRIALSDTLGDVVVGGWRAHTAIRAAIRKSRDERGVDQIVRLRNHTIRTDREHEVDIEVDGVHMMTLTARLDLALQVRDAVVVVRDGDLAAVRSGVAHATGGLRVEGVEIAQETLTFPLAAELSLRRPVDMSHPPGGYALG
jgi:hypothetical protein